MAVDRSVHRAAFPQLLPGAMFILPLAVSCQGLAQGSGSSAEAKAPQVAPAPGSKETFTVQFQDTDIAQALQMLSIQGQKNIITGKNVAGSVSANLFDVTVQEALDVILKANDLRYEEVGNFIYVYTRDEWDQMQQARRKRESRRFSLEYINAKDANEFVSPLLSDGGKVAFLGSVEKGVAPDATSAGEDSWAYQAMLVVNDYPENLQSISELLTEVDTPPAQVSVESTIVSTRVNEDNAWGVDFSIIGDVSFTDFTNPLSAVNNLISGNNTPGQKATDELGFQPANNQAQAGTSTVGQTGRPGGLKVGVISENVSAFIRVLDEVTDVMILARPRVLALNRQRAQILVGEKVGYLSTTTTETSATQTVQYLDTGIKLIFRPFISRDGSIRMELAPSVSEAILRQVTDRIGGGIVIPDEKTNQITTNVRVKDGQTLVLGGLFQEKTTISRRQVPWVGDVPILGAAFKGQDDKIERNEIIFLVTPTIMQDAIAAQMGEAGQVFAEAVRVGAREGLLPFSREAMSGNESQDALEALVEGDTELALYHAENSLRLNKNQPEMVILRNELDKTKPNKVFERDMLKRIMQKRDAVSAATQAANAPAPIPAADPLTMPATVSAAAASTPEGAATTGTDSSTLAPEGVVGGEMAAADASEVGSAEGALPTSEFGADETAEAFASASSDPSSTDDMSESFSEEFETSPISFDAPTEEPIAVTMAAAAHDDAVGPAQTSADFNESPFAPTETTEGQPLIVVSESLVVGTTTAPAMNQDSFFTWFCQPNYSLPWMRYFVVQPVESAVATVPETSPTAP